MKSLSNFFKSASLVAFFLILGLLNSYAVDSIVNQVDNKGFSRITLGKDDAPVIIYEFLSLSCGHCGTVYNDVMPEVKKNYVDRGLVKIIFIDVPLGSSTNLFAHSLVHVSKNKEVSLRLLTALFKAQKEWLSNSNPKKQLIFYAKSVGITDAEIKTAEDENLKSWLTDSATDILKALKISGTPTMILVKKGERIEDSKIRLSGAEPYSRVKRAIDKLLNE
ncbi:DsbA family protein [Candidatus Hepatincolaceae symbiont of Richtersius coronifer]